jgi:hypothetical protein
MRSVRLFVVPIRAAAPSKSRDAISVRGEGCDTADVYYSSYSVPLCIEEASLKSWTSLVCIICVVWFEFQI